MPPPRLPPDVEKVAVGAAGARAARRARGATDGATAALKSAELPEAPENRWDNDAIARCCGRCCRCGRAAAATTAPGARATTRFPDFTRAGAGARAAPTLNVAIILCWTKPAWNGIVRRGECR